MLQAIGEQFQTLLGLGLDVGDVGAVQMALRTIIIYVCSLAIIRIGSKRVLSQASAFDVIVAIMLGSVMSRAIGTIIRSEDGDDKRREVWRILGWTGLIGLALLSSAMAGWFFLKGLPEPILGLLFGVGAGGMLYLTISDLLLTPKSGTTNNRPRLR